MSARIPLPSTLRLFAWITVCALMLLAFASCGSQGTLGPGRFDTVVVDAGHGAHDSGARAYRGSSEKMVALDTAKRVAKGLRKRGFKVIETRTTDVFIPLPRRAAISNAQRNAIFVSIHYNWSPRSSARGVETYYYSPSSFTMASAVQRELARVYSTSDRGVKRRGFYVLRKNAKPSILVECGFLSNPQDNTIAQNAAYRQRIADAIIRGILAARQ